MQPSHSLFWSRKQTLLGLLITVLGVTALYCVKLAEYPYAVHGDVAEIIFIASGLSSWEQLIGPSTWWGISGVMFWPAIIMSKFGVSLVTARLADVLVGIVAMAFLYRIVVRRVGPLAAVVFCFLVASSPQVMQTFRVGLAVTSPFLLSLFFISLSASVFGRDRLGGWKQSILLGIVALFSFLVYIPARIIPVIYGIELVVFGLIACCQRQPRKVQVYLLPALVPLGGFCAYWYAFHHIAPRSDYLFIPSLDNGLLEGVKEWIAHVGYRVWLAVQTIFWTPTRDNGEFYLADHGFFEPLLAVLGCMGVTASVTKRGSFEGRLSLLVIFLASIMLAGILKMLPGFHRLTPAYAGWIFLAIDGYCVIIGKNYRYVIALALLSAVQITWNVVYYFGTIAGPDDRWNPKTLTRLCYFLRDSEPSAPCAAFIDEERMSLYAGHGTIRLLVTNKKLLSSMHADFCSEIRQCSKVAVVSLIEGSSHAAPTIPIERCGVNTETERDSNIGRNVRITALSITPHAEDSLADHQGTTGENP